MMISHVFHACDIREKETQLNKLFAWVCVCFPRVSVLGNGNPLPVTAVFTAHLLLSVSNCDLRMHVP